MSLLQKLNISDAAFTPFLNTGSLCDLALGRFVPGINGSTILSGGLGMTNGITGKPQVYKSTQAHGWAIQILERYPGSEYYIYDTEFSQGDKWRLVRSSSLYLDDPILRERHLEDLYHRIVVTNPEEVDLESFFKKVKEIAALKQAARKEYTVTSPILDPRTGQPLKMFIPTLVSVDSWSEAHALSAMENLDEKDASDSKNNTWFMGDGRVKKLIMSQIPALAAKAGIYFIFTAHIGKVNDMGSYMPTPKDMQYTKQGETTKGVGSAFSFLVSNVVEARKATPITPDNKESQYRLPGSSSTATMEFSRVTDVVIRCKNNNSGSQFSTVVSQKYGVLPCMTNYDYLREMKYPGLGGPGASRSPKSCFLPDATGLGRTTCYETLLKNPALNRALEITAQLVYVQNAWTVSDDDVPFSITPEKLAEELGKTTYAMSEILGSRGWWTYGGYDHIPYLSLFDILAIVKGTYKPKLVPVAAPSKKK